MKESLWNLDSHCEHGQSLKTMLYMCWAIPPKAYHLPTKCYRIEYETESRSAEEKQCQYWIFSPATVETSL